MQLQLVNYYFHRMLRSVTIQPHILHEVTTCELPFFPPLQNVKKRHNSAPHSGDLQFLEETPESELAVLPASISFLQQNESALLQTLISDFNGGTLEFKLAPAYALYMVARHHLSSDYHLETSRHHSLTHMIKQTCSLIKRAVKVCVHSIVSKGGICTFVCMCDDSYYLLYLGVFA